MINALNVSFNVINKKWYCRIIDFLFIDNDVCFFKIRDDYDVLIVYSVFESGLVILPLFSYSFKTNLR